MGAGAPGGPPPAGERERHAEARPAGARPGGDRTARVAGVRLRPTGRTFEYDAGGLVLQRGDAVMVEVAHGLEPATVSVAPAVRPVDGPLPRIVRLADARDAQKVEANHHRAAQALAFARARARERRLPIKVFLAELGHGGGKATIYFSSENRVDFRELVRDLSAELHLRIEMRQVGVRDEAKMVGGIGSCGRELCCTTFLPHFAPVSIRMAKHQNLVLNPAKVSGQCGRLKCCLIYEDAVYVEASKNLPKLGKRVETPMGPGRVGDLDVLAGRVRVYFPDQPPRVFTAHEVRPIAPPAGGAHPPEPEEPDDTPSGLPQS